VLVAHRLRGSIPRRPLPMRALAVVGGVTIGALLAVPASGWTARHAASSRTVGADTIAWLAKQERFRTAGTPIVGIPLLQGPMAGDRLQHDFSWLPLAAACSRVRALEAQGAYLVFYDPPAFDPGRSIRCVKARAPLHRGETFVVFGPSSAGAPR
jgi:hypothetical protein